MSSRILQQIPPAKPVAFGDHYLGVFSCAWCGRPSRSLWQAPAVAGLTCFATAIGIHPLIGYLSPSHLAPAVTAAALFIVSLILTAGPIGGLRIAKSVGREMPTGRTAERREMKG